MAATDAQRQRNHRKEALREFLSQQKLVEHVFDLTRKIENLDPASVVEDVAQAVIDNPDTPPELVIAAYRDKVEFDLKKFKTSAEINLRLVNKYLPDVKQVEVQATVENVTDAAELSDSVLANIAASSSQGATSETGSEEESSQLH